MTERIGRVSAVIFLTWVFLILPAGIDLSAYHGPVPQASFADDRRAPYGSSEGGDYGQRRAVSSKAEARKILEEFFSNKKVKIENIKEKELYFEAEIRDDKEKVIDIVIVDKRTGRIRSIY